MERVLVCPDCNGRIGISIYVVAEYNNLDKMVIQEEKDGIIYCMDTDCGWTQIIKTTDLVAC